MSYNRYSWRPLNDVYSAFPIRKQINENDKKGPSYRMPFGSKFKKVFVKTVDYDNYLWNCNFVLKSKNFESEIYSDLIADPKNPYIVATDDGYGRGTIRIYNLKDGTTHLYYRLKHPQRGYENRNSKENSIAIDLENNHVVEIDIDLIVTDTGLSVVLDKENMWNQLNYWPHLVVKNQKGKYTVYDANKFKQFIDKEFDEPCEVAEKYENNKIVAVGVKAGKTKYVFDKDGNQINSKTSEENEEMGM